MLIIKSYIKPLVLFFLRLCYKQFNFSDNNYPVKTFVKYAFYQKVLGVNRNVKWPVHPTSLFKEPGKITRGTKAPGFARGCYLDARNGIVFEENVWMGPRVSIISMNHDNNDYTKYVKGEPVIIRKNSLLSANAIILAGVELGEHTIVAAGAVVTRSFPQGNCIIGGNPARILKQLGEYAK
jgi:acetyltransferase-like isoleucine patch superfamily enzyme